MLKCEDCHFFNRDCPYEDYKSNKDDSKIVCSYYIDENDFVRKLSKCEKKCKIGQ